MGLPGLDVKRRTDAISVRDEHRERGSTLVELLAATAIMGISVVTLLAGTSTMFMSSAQNRQATSAGIVARNYAEAIDVAVSQGGAWCAGSAAGYGVSSFYTPPPGYSVGASFGACPTNDPAIPQFQRVVITVTSQNGATETLDTVVRKP